MAGCIPSFPKVSVGFWNLFLGPCCKVWLSCSLHRSHVAWIDPSLRLQPPQRKLSRKTLGLCFYHGESLTTGWLPISNQSVLMTFFALVSSSSHSIQKTPQNVDYSYTDLKRCSSNYVNFTSAVHGIDFVAKQKQKGGRCFVGFCPLVSLANIPGWPGSPNWGWCFVLRGYEILPLAIIV